MYGIPCAGYYKVRDQVIERLLENHDTELAESGYELFTGSRLRLLRLKVVAFAEKYDVSDIHVGNIGKCLKINMMKL